MQKNCEISMKNEKNYKKGVIIVLGYRGVSF